MDGDWNENAFLEQAKKYQLVYIFSKNALMVTDGSIQLVDTKITYQKMVSESYEMPSGIAPYRGVISEKLVKLALDSGGYSRFKIDPRLRECEFKKLYRLWIKKALDAGTILEAQTLQGMVAYKVEGNNMSIGLIAVSKESQGHGWGKKLMKAAEVKASSLGAKTISVSTQEANSLACKLYASLGYKISEKMYVYHWWRTKNMFQGK